MPYKDKNDPRAVESRRKAVRAHQARAKEKREENPEISARFWGKKYAYERSRYHDPVTGPRMRERMAAYYAARRTGSPEGWAKAAIVRTKARCLKNEIPFDLTFQDVIPPAFCEVLGVTLDISAGKKDNSPSVDKIVPELGYVRGNVRVISWLANRLKSDITNPDIFEALAVDARRQACRKQ